MAANRNSRMNLGRRGEDAAVQYLQERDYTILERNFRAERGEIDIIARENETLIFVEVKSAKSRAFGDPEDRVNLQKQRQIAKVAAAYLIMMDAEDADCRFDVIAVQFHQNGYTVNHLIDSFCFDGDYGY